MTENETPKVIESAEELTNTVNRLRFIVFILLVVLAMETIGLGYLGTKQYPNWRERFKKHRIVTSSEPWGIHNNIVYHGDPNKKQIALTFDDGPFPGVSYDPTNHSKELLDVLVKNKTVATFFLVGKKAVDSQEQVKADFAAGNTIGNHTYNHSQATPEQLAKMSPEDREKYKRLPNMTPEQLNVEFGMQSDLIEKITGKRPRFCRPPGEVSDPSVVAAAKKLGMVCVFHDVEPAPNDSTYADTPAEKWPQQAKALEDYLLAPGRVKNGSIILLHDGIPATRLALPKVIATLRERGFEFVTLDQMFPAGG
ncbi:MAG: polysaccharide deacetylase family protein [bacterium]